MEYTYTYHARKASAGPTSKYGRYYAGIVWKHDETGEVVATKWVGHYSQTRALALKSAEAFPKGLIN